MPCSSSNDGLVGILYLNGDGRNPLITFMNAVCVTISSLYFTVADSTAALWFFACRPRTEPFSCKQHQSVVSIWGFLSEYLVVYQACRPCDVSGKCRNSKTVPRGLGFGHPRITGRSKM